MEPPSKHGALDGRKISRAAAALARKVRSAGVENSASARATGVTSTRSVKTAPTNLSSPAPRRCRATAGAAQATARAPGKRLSSRSKTVSAVPTPHSAKVRRSGAIASSASSASSSGSASAAALPSATGGVGTAMRVAATHGSHGSSPSSTATTTSAFRSKTSWAAQAPAMVHVGLLGGSASQALTAPTDVSSNRDDWCRPRRPSV